MPNLPISQLPTASALSLTDLVPVVQGGITKQSTINQIATASFNAAAYYGSFYHTASMLVTTVLAQYSMSFSTTDFSNGVSISGSDRSQIVIANPGIYDIQFSAQLDKSTGVKSHVFIWLNQNGTNVPDSNTEVTLDGGAGDAEVAAWNFYARTTTPNEYFKLMYGGTSNNIEILYDSSPSVGPAIPSVILTVGRVG